MSGRSSRAVREYRSRVNGMRYYEDITEAEASEMHERIDLALEQFEAIDEVYIPLSRENEPRFVTIVREFFNGGR